MIFECGIRTAVYCHRDMVSRVDFVCEYLVLVENGEVVVAIVVSPKQEPIAQVVVSVVARFEMKHASAVVGVNGLRTTWVVSHR